jgi:hypothetical protein
MAWSGLDSASLNIPELASRAHRMSSEDSDSTVSPPVVNPPIPANEVAPTQQIPSRLPSDLSLPNNDREPWNLDTDFDFDFNLGPDLTQEMDFDADLDVYFAETDVSEFPTDWNSTFDQLPRGLIDELEEDNAMGIEKQEFETKHDGNKALRKP